MANEIIDIIVTLSNLFRYNIIPIYEEASYSDSVNFVKILLAAFAGSGSAGVLLVYFREKIRQVPLLFCRDHVILCGEDDTTAALVRELASSGTKSVTIITKEGSPAIADIRQYGTVVVTGNAGDPATLSHARLKRAKALLALTDSDGYNAEIALSAMNVIAQRKEKPLTCIIQINNPGLWRIIRERTLIQERESPMRLDFFNGPAIAARVLLGTHFSPFLETWYKMPSLLIVVGAGKLGESLILRASREWFEYAPAHATLDILLVDHHATEIREKLLGAYPHLRDAVRIIPRSVDVQSAGFQTHSFFEEFRHYPRALAFVCLNDDTAGLTAALTLSHHLGGVEASILVRMDHNPGLAHLVGERGTRDHHIMPFSSLAIASQSDLVMGGIREVLARAIHAEYRASQVHQTPPDNPDAATDVSLSPWEQLPESLKESNRRQAEGIMEKLAAIGCDIMPMTDWNAPHFSFSPEEIESLAEMEHARWMDAMIVEGYSFGKNKDHLRKTHPCLIPYSDLPEEEKEKDRITVRKIPSYLALIDFQVYRIRDQDGSGRGLTINSSSDLS